MAVGAISATVALTLWAALAPPLAERGLDGVQAANRFLADSRATLLLACVFAVVGFLAGSTATWSFGRRRWQGGARRDDTVRRATRDSIPIAVIAMIALVGLRDAWPLGILDLDEGSYVVAPAASARWLVVAVCAYPALLLALVLARLPGEESSHQGGS